MKQAFMMLVILGVTAFSAISGSAAELNPQQEALRHCGNMTRCIAIVQANPQAAVLINACARALHGGSREDANLCDSTVFAQMMSTNQASLQ